MSITVNDLLKLMALHDSVTITSDYGGYCLFDGLVKDVPEPVRVMKPCALTSYCEYIGPDTTIQIGVEE